MSTDLRVARLGTRKLLLENLFGVGAFGRVRRIYLPAGFAQRQHIFAILLFDAGVGAVDPIDPHYADRRQK